MKALPLALILLGVGCSTDGGSSLLLPREGGPEDAGAPSVDAATNSAPTLPAHVQLQAPSGTIEIQLGIAGGVNDLDYVASAPGEAIPIGGVGQKGLTARVALRARDPKRPLTLAIIRVELVNTDDSSREPALNNNRSIPIDLECREDGWCYPPVFRIEISHLNRLPALEGTVVTVAAEIATPEDAGERTVGSAQSWGHFVSINGAER